MILRRNFIARCSGALASIGVTGCGTGFSGGVSRARVLIIGDSMMVGGFGATLLHIFERRLGERSVSMYGSCGSSPENWLPNQPIYVTRCGYRASVNGVSEVFEYQTGHRPPPMETPKLDALLQKHRPEAVVVQFGTNWFDEFASGVSEEDLRRKRRQMADFYGLMGPRRVIWILPPDCAKFSKQVQDEVRRFIFECSRSRNVRFVDSRKMTHYVMHKTGGDGVHYNGDAARAWGEAAGAAILGGL